MSRFDKELAHLKRLAEERKNAIPTREQYPKGIERDAYDIWQFTLARFKMPEYMDKPEYQGEPPTYEDVLAWYRKAELEEGGE